MMPMMGGGMNPMLQMLMSMCQPQMQQQGGYNEQAMHDWFAGCMEQYCEDVMEGRRRMPRKFKHMLKDAWRGAKHAVERYRDDDEDDEDEEEYSRPRRRAGHANHATKKGKAFWDKIEKISKHKGSTTNMTDEMMRLFPNATPDETVVIRKMALDYSEDYRNKLNHLMQDDED